MGKHLDAVKAYEEFRAPWETEAGTDAEIDKPKLRRFIYNLLTDKAKAQDSREDALESVKTIQADLDAAKADAASANGEEATKKIAKLEADLTAAKTKVTDLEKAKEQSDLRAEVLAGLDPKYAKYVTGEDREALEKSLEAVKADFGIKDTSDGENEDEDDERYVRTRPRPKLTNPADGGGPPVEKEYDFDKIADGIIGNSIFG